MTERAHMPQRGSPSTHLSEFLAVSDDINSKHATGGNLPAEERRVRKNTCECVCVWPPPRGCWLGVLKQRALLPAAAWVSLSVGLPGMWLTIRYITPDGLCCFEAQVSSPRKA